MEVAGLAAGRFLEVVWVPETGSTNQDLTSEAGADFGRARVRFTDLQTAGRGRRDRRWDMEPGGGLLISFYVPWRTTATAHLVPTALGVAAVDAVADVGRQVGLKWPNDLVVSSGEKLGGMLGNTVLDGTELAGVVIGLGCNVSWPPAGESGLESATSLDRLGESPVDRWELAQALISRFDQELGIIESAGPNVLHDRYRQRCLTIGKLVRIENSDGSFTSGIATDIDPSGALLLDVDGIQRRIDVGDVVHVRPAAEGHN